MSNIKVCSTCNCKQFSLLCYVEFRKTVWNKDINVNESGMNSGCLMDGGVTVYFAEYDLSL